MAQDSIYAASPVQSAPAHAHARPPTPESSIDSRENGAHLRKRREGGADHDIEHGQEEDRTELSKTLSERHNTMIAFSATVGIGLFLQAGKVNHAAGPGGSVICYLLMGTIIWSALASIGEMTAFLPVRGPIFELPSRFIDQSTGFAVGWMAWFSYCIIIATELGVIAYLFRLQFPEDYLAHVHYPSSTLQWNFGLHTSPVVWIFLFSLVVLGLNLLPVRAYGEVEYVFGILKITFISILILLMVLINVGSVGTQGYLGFKYYNAPWGFFSKSFSIVDGAGKSHLFTGGAGQLAGMWTGMTTVLFSMASMEAVVITAAENKDLDRDESIKLSTRKISLRIILLYTLAAFLVGLNVPSDDPNLLNYAAISLPSGDHSIFVIAAVRAALKGWPMFMNGFFIFSAMSAGVNALYMASRVLHALAKSDGVWPHAKPSRRAKALLERCYRGVPRAAVFVSWLFGFLSFLAVRNSREQDLGRLSRNATVSILIVYALGCAAFLQYWKCLRAEANPNPAVPHEPGHRAEMYNRENDSLYPYKSHWQRARAAYGLVGCSVMALFNGWSSLVGKVNGKEFVAAYIPLVIFSLLVCAYHAGEQGLNPLKWRREPWDSFEGAITLRNPDPRLRRGRLHRVDRTRVLGKENLRAYGRFAWAWLK